MSAVSETVSLTALAGRILIGGHALHQLGSSRYTEDVDYLINDLATKAMFLHDAVANHDYVNANGHKFFALVYKQECGRPIASPQGLLELKAFAFVQHCLNRNFRKADEAEFDIKFLVREFQLRGVKLVNPFLTVGELSEVEQVIAGVLNRQQR